MPLYHKNALPGVVSDTHGKGAIGNREVQYKGFLLAQVRGRMVESDRVSPQTGFLMGVVKSFHIVLNGNFWCQPDVGSGQYLHGLVRWLPRVAPHHRYTVLIPRFAAARLPAPSGVSLLPVGTPFDGMKGEVGENLAKLWFEQIGVPQAVRVIQASGEHPRAAIVVHIPYFAPPLRCPAPVVVTVPDIIPLRLPAYRGGLLVRAYMLLVSQTIRFVSHIITFSRHSQNEILAHLPVHPQRVTTILLAAHERYYSYRSCEDVMRLVAERYHLEKPFVYYVGGIDVRKNVETLIRAFAQLCRQQTRPQGGDAILAIAGRPVGRSSTLFPDLDTLIAQSGATSAIRRIDVPGVDNPLLYQACTVFAFPSRYEGFGLPPLEAMACGAPVVVSNASSLPEVVGDAAWLVDPDDVAGWAEAIGALLDDVELREQFRRRSLERAAQFSWERVAEETRLVYERVAEA